MAAGVCWQIFALQTAFNRLSFSNLKAINFYEVIFHAGQRLGNSRVINLDKPGWIKPADTIKLRKNFSAINIKDVL